MQKKGDMSGKRRFALAVVMVAMVATSAARIAPAAVGALQPDGVMTYHHLSREHTWKPVHYKQNPPVGGPHAPIWQNCGFYYQPVKNEYAVHSMEHGAVWIAYQLGIS